ncbi:MAG: hypothetical protein E1N59_1794 [Puniceicoccaceae bacterium 5H]|nr:MAG: hypothetical protein E1N59_1794 [Puniceicoccaceae bacterium 5H]
MDVNQDPIPAEPKAAARGWKWPLIGALALVVAGGGSFYGYHAFKTQRARSLARDGLAVLEVQSRQEAPDRLTAQNAWEDVRAAYALRPQDPEVLVAVAQAADLIAPDQAPAFWQDLVDLEPDALNWTQRGLAALEAGDLEAARQAATAVEDFTPPLPWAYWELKARLALEAQAWHEAFAAATQVIEQAPEGEMAALLPLQVARMSPMPDDDREAWNLLHAAYGDGRLTPAQLQRAANELREADLGTGSWVFDALAAQGTVEAKLVRLELMYRLGRISPAHCYEAARALLPPDDAARQLRLGRWLNGQGLAVYTLEILPQADALSRRDLLEVYVDALVQQRQWPRVVEVLEQPDVPVEEVPRYLALLQAHAALGEDRAMARAREKVLLAAGRDAVALRHVAERTARLGLYPVAITALDRLAEQPARAAWAELQLYAIYKQQGDLDGILRSLDHLRQLKPDDVGVLNDWCYFQLLDGRDVQTVLPVIQPVAEAHPDLLFPRTTYAWALLQAGEPEKALALLQEVRELVDWSQAQNRQQLILALVLQANGHSAAARQYAELVDPTGLLEPEQRLRQGVL